MTTFNVENNNKPFLTFTRDGKIIVGEGYTPDEAGRKAIDAMREQFKTIYDMAREEGRNEVRQQFSGLGYEIHDGAIVYVERLPIHVPADEQQ